MKNYLIFFCLIQQLIVATIIETEHFAEIYDVLDPHTLILLDIDNTLMTPKQQLGSDQWFRHRIPSYQSQGLSPIFSLEKALSEWMAVQNITEVILVEEETEKIIHNLQRRGYSVMGLTTRGLGLSTRTVEQLKRLGIDLTVSAPEIGELFFQNETRSILYRGGILFTAGSHKGSALKKFLKEVPTNPNRILFINDKRRDLEQVESFCQEAHIPFIGLRYRYLDAWVAQFDPLIADIQFQAFGQILSDEEAKKILQEQKIDTHVVAEQRL